jgi:Flp pilus assembly protein TadG
MQARFEQRSDAAKTRRRDSRRGGVITLEFLLVFPIVMIAFFALFEFGMLFVCLQTIETAAVEGAREKAKGRIDTQVISHIDEILALHNIAAVNRRIVIENPPLVTMDTGATPTVACTPQGDAPVAGEVRVTICLFVSLNDAPVPDILANFGLSIADQKFEISALAESEE